MWLGSGAAACVAALHGEPSLAGLSGGLLPVDRPWITSDLEPAASCVHSGGVYLLFSPGSRLVAAEARGRGAGPPPRSPLQSLAAALRAVGQGPVAEGKSLLGICRPSSAACGGRRAEVELGWHGLLSAAAALDPVWLGVGAVPPPVGAHIYARLASLHDIREVKPPGVPLKTPPPQGIERLSPELQVAPVGPLQPACYNFSDAAEVAAHDACCKPRRVKAWQRNSSRDLGCWPKSVELAQFYNPIQCCYRAATAVHAVIVGFAKASTSAMQQILSEHAEVITDTGVEDDLLTLTEEPLSLDLVRRSNEQLEKLQRSKPGSRIRIVKSPMLVFNSQAMWRLSQVPGVKVVLMLREPTRWLLSLYNQFLSDCHLNETEPSCCRAIHHGLARHRTCPQKLQANRTDFWRDIAAGGRAFGRWGFTRFLAQFTHHFVGNVLPRFRAQDIYILDGSLLEMAPSIVVPVVQDLLGFLGAHNPFPHEQLVNSLERWRRKRKFMYDYKQVSFRRERLCPTSLSHRQLANRMFQAERRALMKLLQELMKRGVRSATSQRLFGPPCDL